MMRAGAKLRRSLLLTADEAVCRASFKEALSADALIANLS
jgi:hypothetical protein